MDVVGRDVLDMTVAVAAHVLVSLAHVVVIEAQVSKSNTRAILVIEVLGFEVFIISSLLSHLKQSDSFRPCSLLRSVSSSFVPQPVSQGQELGDLGVLEKEHRHMLR